MDKKMKEIMDKLTECHKEIQGTDGVLVVMFGAPSEDNKNPNCLVSEYGSGSAIAYFIDKMLSDDPDLLEDMIALKLSKIIKDKEAAAKDNPINKMAI